jgi:TIR domain-containing protein
MAYVTGFDQDVFISFTHDDNLSLAGSLSGQDGWVSLFERSLAGYLSQRLPEKRKVVVWRDPEIRSNDILSQKIDREVSRAAVLVCVMSPRYLKAPWCQKEVSMFWRSRPQDFEPRIAERLRIFKVLVHDPEEVRRSEGEMSEQDYPAELRDTLGRSFFDANPAKENFTQLFWPRGLEDPDQRFNVRIEKLANDIASLLEVMRKKVDGQSRLVHVGPVEQKASSIVYLAEVTEDLDDDRYQLKQDLERAGVRVVPDDSLSNKRVEAEEEIRRALAEAQFAVHLFSDRYGKPMRDDRQCSLPHLQFLLGRERAAASKGSFTRYVWIDDAIVDRKAIASPQREFLASVEGESDANAPIDLQDGSLQRLKESLLRRVTKPIRPIAPKSRRTLVYVTGQTADVVAQDATTLIDYLKQSHDVFRSATDDDDERKRKQHEKYCQLSDGLVLLYGQAPSEWVQDKAFDIRELAVRRRERPLAAAVYETPPPSKGELPIHFEDILLVDGRNGFDPQELKPFIERMEAGG